MTKEKEGRNAILGKFSYFSPCRESSLGEKSGGRIDARKPPSPLPSSSFPFPLSTRLKYHENSFRKLDFFPLTPPPPSSAAALAIAPFNHGLGVPWGESEGDAVEEGRSQICLVASLILPRPPSLRNTIRALPEIISARSSYTLLVGDSTEKANRGTASSISIFSIHNSATATSICVPSGNSPGLGLESPTQECFFSGFAAYNNIFVKRKIHAERLSQCSIKVGLPHLKLLWVRVQACNLISPPKPAQH